MTPSQSGALDSGLQPQHARNLSAAPRTPHLLSGVGRPVPAPDRPFERAGAYHPRYSRGSARRPFADHCSARRPAPRPRVRRLRAVGATHRRIAARRHRHSPLRGRHKPDDESRRTRAGAAGLHSQPHRGGNCSGRSTRATAAHAKEGRRVSDPGGGHSSNAGWLDGRGHRSRCRHSQHARRRPATRCSLRGKIPTSYWREKNRPGSWRRRMWPNLWVPAG